MELNDINECLNKTICPGNSQCNNVLGSYSCRCNSGYYDPNSSINSQNPACILIPTTTAMITTTTSISKTTAIGSTSTTSAPRKIFIPF